MGTQGKSVSRTQSTCTGRCAGGCNRQTKAGPALTIHNPSHPGDILKRQCLEPMGLTVTQAAQKLTVSPEALLEVINERAGISMEMARRLAEAFGLTAETRLGMQRAYDLWQARCGMGELAVGQFSD